MNMTRRQYQNYCCQGGKENTTVTPTSKKKEKTYKQCFNNLILIKIILNLFFILYTMNFAYRVSIMHN